MVRDFLKLSAPLARRVRLMVGRGIVRLVNDSTKIQEVQISALADMVRDRAERFQNYGITSNPFPDAEAAYVSVGGSTDHIIIIAVDDRRYRLKSLAPGEVSLYDDQGQKVHLKRDGKIEVVALAEVTVTAPVAIVNASTRCQVNSPEINLAGDRGTLRSLIDERLLALFNGHVHAGVQAGSGTTGAPTTTLTQGNTCTTVVKAG